VRLPMLLAIAAGICCHVPGPAGNRRKEAGEGEDRGRQVRHQSK
jgi:hypothetical protein